MAGNEKDSTRAAPLGGSLREAPPEHLGQLLGLITHDLRNPLAALASNVGFLQMVATELQQEGKEAVDDLQISVEALGRIADGLELLGHELTGRRGGEPGTDNVGSVIRSIRKSVERSAASHEVTLTFSIERYESVRFLAASLEFSRALTALIHNALSVAPARSVVTVRVLTEGRQVIFRVEDGGARLTEEMLEAVGTVEAQNRLKSDKSARYSRGLGLFTVQRWADRAQVQFRLGPDSECSSLELVAPLV